MDRHQMDGVSALVHELIEDKETAATFARADACLGGAPNAMLEPLDSDEIRICRRRLAGPRREVINDTESPRVRPEIVVEALRNSFQSGARHQGVERATFRGIAKPVVPWLDAAGHGGLAPHRKGLHESSLERLGTP